MQTTNLAFDTGGIISLLVGTVLPLLVGLITTESLNAGLKAAILAAISGVSGVLGQWLNAINSHTHFAWQAAVLSALITWLVAESSYMKVWKRSGIADKVQAVGVTSPQGVDTAVDPTGTTSADTPDPDDTGSGRHAA